MSEANWIVLLCAALALTLTLLVPRYFELKEKVRQQDLKLNNLVKELRNQGELSDELVLALLEKKLDADLEKMFVDYMQQIDSFKNVARDKDMDRYYVFCTKIKEHIASETMRRAEYKKNNN